MAQQNWVDLQAGGDDEPGDAPLVTLGNREVVLKALQVVLLLFIFLVGIRALGTGFKGLGKGVLDSFFTATENPFIGLVIGILATTLVQSSSVTTSMVVALVAAPGSPLPIANAIPMIMGANIGTTVTNTIVSLGHMNRPAEFRRAFAAATCHDFFNFIAVATLLPLELATGFLTRASGVLAGWIGTGGPGKLPNPIKSATKAALAPVGSVIEGATPSATMAAVVMIVVGAITIFVALVLIVRTLRSLAETKLKTIIESSLGKRPFMAILVGIGVTVMVQSSSITTSILVPLAAAGILSLEQAFSIALGANVGTTITALIASAAAPPETAHLAVQIALVHLLFNVIGIALVYPNKKIRNIPLRLSRWLADVATRSRGLAVVYVMTLFYGTPGALLVISRSIA